MDIIMDYRQTGKTTELIKMSAEKNEYILVANRQRASEVQRMAQNMGLNILYPITLHEYLDTRMRGSFIKNILIDDADLILQEIFNTVTIDCITMSKENLLL